MRELRPILKANIVREEAVMTDEAINYSHLKHVFASHETLNHSEREYVRRGEPTIHMSTIDGYCGIFKRGMKGVYQHCSKKHSHRYMSEFNFRYPNRSAGGVDDTNRATKALLGVVGKRLMYRDTSVA